MSIFDYFRKPKRYVDKEEVDESVSMQRTLNAAVLDNLNIFDVDDETELRVEFFFYTDTQDKASNLAIELNKLNYNVETVDTSAADASRWLVSGWTPPMNMSLESLSAWSERMCQLGFENDCKFDGWGTFPDQDDFDEYFNPDPPENG